MRGHVTALLTQYEYARHPGNLVRVVYWLPCYYGGWVLRRALGRRQARADSARRSVDSLPASVTFSATGATPAHPPSST